MAESAEKTDQALQVLANAGARKLDYLQRLLDYKDKVRQDRRQQRILDKGY